VSDRRSESDGPTPGNADAVYFAARAEQVGTDGIEIFDRCSAAQGLDASGAERVPL
jgi:hypothetical protein